MFGGFQPSQLVQLRGGELIIRVLPDRKLLMTGSAVTVYEGVTEV